MRVQYYMEVSTDQLDTILSEKEFPNSTNNGCVSFATALDKLFDVESFPCAFDPWDDSKPLHAMAIIDGVVFDANGSHGSDPTIVQDWWSGLKPNDFGWVEEEAYNEQGEQVRDKWNVMYEGLEEMAYINAPEITHIGGAEESQIQQYINLIQESFKEHGFEPPTT